MTIPSTPVFYDMKYVDKNGKLTTESHLYNDDLFQTLNVVVNLLNQVIYTFIASGGNVTNNGMVAVNKTTTQINDLASETSTPVGTFWFDTTISKLKVLTAPGVVQTITSA